MSEQVILVDDDDREIGAEDKLEAHLQARLHRAFSVFIYRPSGEMLIQRRAARKYHSAGLWSNACCGHPRPGEATIDAATRRLREELGLACRLTPAGHFRYKTALDGGLTENEYDHVFVGVVDEDPAPALDEVSAWQWIPREALRAQLAAKPEIFTVWLPLAFSVVDAGGRRQP